MAVYKVAQDVEADDKIIGPFSVRQFVYLIIVVLAGLLSWGLSQLFLPLFVIPLPIILFFGALALPLRKDQPMEIYLQALISFYLKPRRRLWIPDGIESLVVITAPQIVEVQRTKDLSQVEASRRLSYLANIADTGGWAIRNTADPYVNTALNNDVWFAAQQTEDVLDEEGGVAANFDNMIAQADQRHRQNIVQQMQQQASATQSMPVQPVQATAQIQPKDQYAIPNMPESTVYQPAPVEALPEFNPYPNSIRQSVVQPLDSDDRLPETPPEPVIELTQVYQSTPAPAPMPTPIVDNNPVNTSEKPTSPDIINLASNSDLSIETIQREAERINKKSEEKDSGEVYIPLH